MKKSTFLALAVAAMAFAACGQKTAENVNSADNNVDTMTTVITDTVTASAVDAEPVEKVQEEVINEDALKSEAQSVVRNIFTEVLTTFSNAYNGSADYSTIESVADRYCSDAVLAQVLRDNQRDKAKYDADYPNDEGPGFDEKQVWQCFVGEGAWDGCELGPCSVKSVAITSCEGNVVSFKVIEKVPNSTFKSTTYVTGKAEKRAERWFITSLKPEKCL